MISLGGRLFSDPEDAIFMRIPVDKKLKSEYTARATRGYQKLQVLLRFHARGS